MPSPLIQHNTPLRSDCPRRRQAGDDVGFRQFVLVCGAGDSTPNTYLPQGTPHNQRAPAVAVIRSSQGSGSAAQCGLRAPQSKRPPAPIPFPMPNASRVPLNVLPDRRHSGALSVTNSLWFLIPLHQRLALKIYVANHTHTRARAHMHAHTHTRARAKYEMCLRAFARHKAKVNSRAQLWIHGWRDVSRTCKDA